jgi:hypothetical protein
MSRLFRVAGLSLLMLAAFGSLKASATTVTPDDPIVRTRGGGGSIQFFTLPFTFSFGSFPDDPDGPVDPDDPEGPGSNCSVGPDSIHTELTAVTCNFQNLTNQTISLLNFTFGIPGDTSSLIFDTEDPDERWGSGDDRSITAAGARFTGGNGLVSGSCIEGCSGGEFAVDIIGFPEGTTVSMTADVTAVPEPASLMLIGTGLALAAGRARRRVRR